MARSIIVGSTLTLAFALALPVSAGAQAIPRPEAGSSSSGSAGSSGSSASTGGAGSSSTSSGGGDSRGGAGGAGRVDGPSSIDFPRSSGRTAPGGSRSAASPDGGRIAATPGGIGQRSSGSGGVSDLPSIDLPNLGGRLGTGSGRTNPGSQVAGFAAARSFDLTPISFPFYSPYGQYYPLFGSGFGYGYGYAYYDPWRYGATRWLWSRYGMWYDPWGYDPYANVPYSSSGYSSSVRDTEPKRTGSIRLKANQTKAKVYIDGALVGVVDEFDGLSNHLELEGGPHQLELRAEGYETYVGVLVVEAGKTYTERVNLKRVKK